jgi:hypothetical protein
LPSGSVYYQERDTFLVRADITYLKQDFSALQPVRDHGAWPEMQRYDYLIRRRELSVAEAQDLAKKPATGYPQRESVIFALRELSGMDAGTSAKDWRKALASKASRK